MVGGGGASGVGRGAGVLSGVLRSVRRVGGGGVGALDRHRSRAGPPVHGGVRWWGGVSCYQVSYYE